MSVYLNDWNQVNSCFLKYFSQHPSCLELEDESIVWHPGGTISCYECVQQENVAVPQKGEVPVQSEYGTTLPCACKTNCELEIPPRERKCNRLVIVHGHFARWIWVLLGSCAEWVSPCRSNADPEGPEKGWRARCDSAHLSLWIFLTKWAQGGKKTGHSVFVYTFIRFQLMVFTLKQQEILEQG